MSKAGTGPGSGWSSYSPSNPGNTPTQGTGLDSSGITPQTSSSSTSGAQAVDVHLGDYQSLFTNQCPHDGKGSGTAYRIKLEDDDHGEELQKLIDAANKAVLDAWRDAPEWMKTWRGPLIFERLPDALKQVWANRFHADSRGEDWVSLETATTPQSKHSYIQKPNEVNPSYLQTPNDDVLKQYTYVDPWTWRTMGRCLFARHTFSPDWRGQWATDCASTQNWSKQGYQWVWKFLGGYLSKLDPPGSSQLAAIRDGLRREDLPQEEGAVRLYSVDASSGGHQAYLGVRREGDGWRLTYYDRSQPGYDTTHGVGYIKRPDSASVDPTGEMGGRPVSVKSGDSQEVQKTIDAICDTTFKNPQETYDKLKELGPLEVRDSKPSQQAQHMNALNCPWANVESFLLDETNRDEYERVKLGFRWYAIHAYVRSTELALEGPYAGDLKHVGSDFKQFEAHLMRAQHKAQMQKREGIAKAYGDLLEYVRGKEAELKEKFQKAGRDGQW
jgi:hypothetical protein